MVAAGVATGCLLALAGCGSLRNVTAFADDTSRMAGAVRQEIQQVARLCDEAADLRVLLAEATPTGNVAAARELRGSCRLAGRASVAFQEVTVDTLDLYAKTLTATVKDDPSSVRRSIDGTRRKLATLKDREGNALVDEAGFKAAGGVLSALAEAATREQREQAVGLLLNAAPDLAANARALRGFFAQTPGPSDYDAWLATTAGISRGTAISLEIGKPMAAAEPIRAAELRRESAALIEAVDRRRSRAGVPGEVPRLIVEALDAWIALLPVLQAEGLSRSPERLPRLLEALRERTAAAREALDADPQPTPRSAR